MKNIIDVKDIVYTKQNIQLLNSITFDIKLGEFVSIVGPVGSGKTSLLKVLTGLENIESGRINIFGKDLYKSKKEIKKSFGIVFDGVDSSFVCDKVYDELVFPLKNLSLSLDEVNNRVKEISKVLNIDDLLDYTIHNLSGGQKQLISLGRALIIYPKVLIIDQSFDMVDLITKEKIFSLLKKFNRDKETTIIYATDDLEETLYTDRIILLCDGKICLDKKTKEAYKDDKLFQAVGLGLPFIVDLSKKLQYYDLVDKIEFKMDKLVNELWK